MEYFGIVKLVSVDNEVFINDAVAATFIPLKYYDVRMVHYPDSQQIVIWLPQYGEEYGGIRLLNETEDIFVFDGQIKDKLNGAIQILWDTLSLAPAEYRLEIDWKDRCQHIVFFKKNEPVPGKKDMEALLAEAAKEKEKLQQIKDKDKRIAYEGTLRAGSVTYIENDTRIKFDHEMGGGNCLAYIFIPSKENWERATKTPLASRKDILRFIAETVKKEQASGTRVEITDTQISFFTY